MKLGSFGLTLLSVSTSLWLLTAEARAQTAQPTIALTNCPPALGTAVEAALDVELSMVSPTTRRAFTEGTLRCALVCDETGTTALVTQGDERTEQHIVHDGPGHARRLAIALAELLDASGAPPVEAPVAEVNPTSELRIRARIALGAWLGGEPFSALGALELGVEIAPTSNLAWVIAAAGTLGSIEVDSGRLDVRLLSLATSLRFGGEVESFWLGGGPAVRGGAVFWTGHPNDPSRATGRDLTGGWLGLGAVATALLRLPELPVRIGLEIEGGGIAFSSGALVYGALAARIGGGWLETRLVVDLTFD
jgi:hypothetical protein